MSERIHPTQEHEETVEKSRAAEKVFGSTFCFAKWYHGNIYFQTGETHSCYHPQPHKIDVKSLKNDPSQLHNTSEKKEERRLMLSEQKPSGCQYCWNIEALNRNLISDRITRTASLYSENRIEEIKKIGSDGSVIPNYLEISFSNQCNFKCGYCHPKASSRYYQEIKEHGPYPTRSHNCDIKNLEILSEEGNPYLEAWWRWWPELKTELRILRLTGGEPLLQKSTYQMLARFNEDPCPQLQLMVNSNLGSPNSVVRSFCEQVAPLVDAKKLQSFRLYTSIDTWGEQAEYIRTGLKLDLFEKNVRHFLETTAYTLNFMITFNLFSFFNFEKLLRKILELRREYSSASSQHFHRIRFDISYLKEPIQYDMHLLPKELSLPLAQRILDFMRAHTDNNRPDAFSTLEVEKFRRIFEFLQTTTYDYDRLQQGRADFRIFFSEQDKRRNTSLLSVFPELQDFWNSCSAPLSTPTKSKWAYLTRLLTGRQHDSHG